MTMFLQSDFEVEWVTLKGLHCLIHPDVFVLFKGDLHRGFLFQSGWVLQCVLFLMGQNLVRTERFGIKSCVTLKKIMEG